MNYRHFVYLLLIISLIWSCKTSSKGTSGTPERSGRSKTDTVAVDPKSRAMFHDAMKEIVLGNYQKAETLFRQCTENNPYNAAAWYELGRLYYDQDRIAEAIPNAEKAVTLSSDNVWYKLFLAELYENGGRIDDASSIYQKLTRDYPSNHDYYLMLANSYLLSGKYSDAIKVYDQIESQAGVSEEISLQKQKIYMAQQKPEKALEELKKLSDAFPGETRYISMLAELYMSMEKYNEAYQMYMEVLRLNPSDPYIHMSLADYYRRTGDKERSFEELVKGFESKSLDIDTKITILLSYYSITESFEELKPQAFKLIDVLVETHPADPKAYSIRSDFLARDEKYAEAREDLLRVIDIDSSRYLVWEMMLRMDAELEDVDAMKDHGVRATALFPMQPVPYLFLGLAAFQKKEYQEAIKAFERGYSFVVDNNELKTSFQMYLGDTYYQTGDAGKAFQAYEKVLKTDPDNAYVLNNYSYYLALRKEQLSRAAGMARRANELSPGNASYEDTYAWVLYQQGYYSEALEWMEKALASTNDPSAEILEHYGDVLYQLGQLEKAYEYWQKALEKGKGSDFLEKKVKERKLYE